MDITAVDDIGTFHIKLFVLSAVWGTKFIFFFGKALAELSDMAGGLAE